MHKGKYLILRLCILSIEELLDDGKEPTPDKIMELMFDYSRRTMPGLTHDDARHCLGYVKPYLGIGQGHELILDKETLRLLDKFHAELGKNQGKEATLKDALKAASAFFNEMDKLIEASKKIKPRVVKSVLSIPTPDET